MMDIVTKDFAVVDAGESDEHPNGAFHVILSAPTHDRDGEIVDSKAFDPLPEHISFDTDHSMTCDSVVGSGVPMYAEDGTLQVKGGYCSDDRSQVIRQKVKDGHIRTTSVTFMAAERVTDTKGVPHVVKAEILNGTFTPVPANRESVVLSAKSIVAHAVAAKAGARSASADAAAIQSDHDAMVARGATCAAGKAAPKGEFKSVAGSLEETQDRVRDALNDAYGTDSYVWLRATIPADGGGTCVYEIDMTDGSECETYQESYIDDGSEVTLSGDQALVDLTEVITPDADADRETADASKSADITAGAAAEQAAAPTVKSADDEARDAALLSITENAARLAFGG
jgi:hypothetical protein